MDNPAPQKAPRSPLFYVVLGCGGLAALMCLGGVIFMLVAGKLVSDVGSGFSDAKEKRANAVKQLGGIPDSYEVVASVNLFVMQMTLLADASMLDDGGLDMDTRKHVFSYFDVMASENNKPAREFLNGKQPDPSALAKSGIKLGINGVIKRGQLTIDGRKVFWVTSRGKLQSDGQQDKDDLNTAVLFDCVGESMKVGIWSQPDPDPLTSDEALDLAGTVGDEAELARFLKPINPCR